MSLRECPPFAEIRPLRADDARAALERLAAPVPAFDSPLYLGFVPARDWQRPVEDVQRDVDAFFALQPELGFETRPSVLTAGLRSSRFALVLFWEAMHQLRRGGLWIDIDETAAIGRSVIGAGDVLERPYFARSLVQVDELRHEGLTARLFEKRHDSLASRGIDDEGWTFGILTSGPSPNACRMVAEIAGLGLPSYEVIVCGPDPGLGDGTPHVRRIDLDAPEPRGWITRKKNLVAERARFENLVLLHDRFRVPRGLAVALGKLGPAPGMTSFPQLFFPDRARTLFFRNVDYQALLPITPCLEDSQRLVNFRLDQFAYPRYDDWRETVHLNGGAYVARRSLWNAVPQDEALFHGEWEDIVHGLACHRFGIPQRVNPHAVLESVYAHYSTLAHLQLPRLAPDGSVERGRGLLSSVFLANRLLAPGGLKPIGRTTEESLRSRALALVSRLPAAARARLTNELARPVRSPSELCRRLERALAGTEPTSRAEALALVELVRRAIASPIWHASYVQRLARELELHAGAWRRLLARERRSLAAWEALYPRFFDPAPGEAASRAIESGGSARRRALQRAHWRSAGSRDLVYCLSSLGEQPDFSCLPDDGEPVAFRVALGALLLQPFDKLLASRRVRRWLSRAVRLVFRRGGDPAAR